MSAPNVLPAYLSPETVLPLTSIVATIAGGAMLLTWRSIRFVVPCFRGVIPRPQRIARASEPHVNSRRAMLAEETWD